MTAPDTPLSVESHKDPVKIPSLTDPSLIFLNVTPIKNVQPAFLPPLNLKDDKDQRSKEPRDMKDIPPPNSLYLPPVFNHDYDDSNMINDDKIGNNTSSNQTNPPSFFSILYFSKWDLLQKLFNSCKLK